MAFFLISIYSLAQNNSWQQEVNYNIRVRLDDRKHTLKGAEEITYINNSPVALDTIYIHLWPNAYKSNSTALARQLLENGETSFYFSKEEERGFIDSLNFKVNGSPAKWHYHRRHQDICYILLPTSLKSKDSITISTDFFVKIPDARFSRLGHTGEAYFMTQWYPKPAVYDKNGWHAMPYLNQGEFFGEYGSFDVSITLPQNYLMAATGDRIDAEEELRFLEEQQAQTKKHISEGTRKTMGMDFPASSPSFKTVRFRQYRVHDFAWFADKRFYVLKDQVELPESKRIVDTWIFFTDRNFDKWKKACGYVNDAVLFYSRLVGDYPYNHATALDGTIVAGGGMEYPNITVIGDASSDFELDMVITHEVGHNWFYGILGSNERRHPFLDEGINSLYEMRYVKAKYPGSKLSTFIGRDSSFKLFGMNNIPLWKYHEISFLSAYRNNADQPMNLRSPEYSKSNYGSIVYSKTALSFYYLMNFMGEENFDAAMKNYFQNFKFRHPQPEDLFNSLASSTASDLSWFRTNFYDENKRFDLKIKSVKRNDDGSWKIKVKDKRGSGIPFPLQVYRNGRLAGEIWNHSPGKIRELSFPPTEASRFVVDAEGLIPDWNRKNNALKTSGLFRRSKPIQAKFLFALEDPSKKQLAYLPLLGGNYYNGFMLGLAFHNLSLYPKKFEWMLAPMYGFKSKTPAGYAEAAFNFHPRRFFRGISLGSRFKSFSFDEYQQFLNLTSGEKSNSTLSYYRFSPFIQFDLKMANARSAISQKIKYTMHNVFYERSNFFFQGGDIVRGKKYSDFYMINRLSYQLENDRAINPYTLHFAIDHNLEMAKLAGSLLYTLVFSEKYAANFRLFAGGFFAGNPRNRGPYAIRASGINGWQDYAFEGNYIARNERQGLGFSQFMESDGAMKVYTPVGQSSEWLAAINFTSPKLGPVPIRIFADAVVCDGRYLLEDQFLWDAGLQFRVWKDIIEVYYPLAYNNDIKKLLELNRIEWYNRFRFTLNIHKLDIKALLHNSFI